MVNEQQVDKEILVTKKLGYLRYSSTLLTEEDWRKAHNSQNKKEEGTYFQRYIMNLIHHDV